MLLYKNFKYFTNYKFIFTKFYNSTLSIKSNLNILNNYLLKWLKLFDNYDKINDYKSLITSGSILAHQFSSLPIRCHGCGAFFHTNKNDIKGYIEKKDLVMLMKNVISFYDMRCKNCKNCISIEENKTTKIMSKREYKNELKFLETKPTLYLHVIDVCNIKQSIEAEYYKKCHKESNIIFIVNKIDKISKDVINLKETIIQEINNQGKWDMNKIIDVVCISCKDYYGVISLFKILEKTTINRDICIVGKSNVGKSSIFNMIQNVIHLGHNRRGGEKILPIQSTVGLDSGITQGLIRHPISSRYIQEGYRYLKRLIMQVKI